MINLLFSSSSALKVVSLLETDNTDLTRMLGFDKATLLQIFWQWLAIMILFIVLAKLLFNPVREILRKRSQEIETTLDKIEADEKAASQLKADYEDKLKSIKAEADKILAHAHTKAVAREDEIVKAANEEAAKIMQRAHLEIKREQEQMKDDIRREIIDVATIMAEKFVQATLTEEQQRVLVNETINEMGDDTWLN